ncbi:hypothetical protein [Pseudomonas fluorescens]|uniref:hypothetical protein n=1 Tax=Pseudomonas fluorescens TaxID=294 RepID=UPI00123F6598|nr:hypothetical protein [Pseudomonas fluorescens]
MSLAFTGVCSRIKAAFVRGGNNMALYPVGAGLTKQFIDTRTFRGDKEVQFFTRCQVSRLVVVAKKQSDDVAVKMGKASLSQSTKTYTRLLEDFEKRCQRAKSLEKAAQNSKYTNPQFEELVSHYEKAVSAIKSHQEKLTSAGSQGSLEISSIISKQAGSLGPDNGRIHNSRELPALEARCIARTDCSNDRRDTHTLHAGSTRKESTAGTVSTTSTASTASDEPDLTEQEKDALKVLNDVLVGELDGE